MTELRIGDAVVDRQDFNEQGRVVACSAGYAAVRDADDGRVSVWPVEELLVLVDDLTTPPGTDGDGQAWAALEALAMIPLADLPPRVQAVRADLVRRLGLPDGCDLVSDGADLCPGAAAENAEDAAVVLREADGGMYAGAAAELERQAADWTRQHRERIQTARAERAKARAVVDRIESEHAENVRRSIQTREVFASGDVARGILAV